MENHEGLDQIHIWHKPSRARGKPSVRIENVWVDINDKLCVSYL